MAENLDRAETRRDGSFAMGADYIPERDIKAAVWMKIFAATLLANPEIYRTTSEDAAEIDALVQAFRVANAICGRPITNSPVARRAKNDARKAAERLLRPAATRINNDPRISSDLKVTIGVKPRRKRRREVAAPQSVPVLSLRSDLGGQVHVRVRDSISFRRARPRSAVGLQLYERVVPVETQAQGLSAPDSPAVANVGADEVPPGWRFVGVFTRSLFTIIPQTKSPGDAVELVARWFTRRGEPGAFGNSRVQNVCRPVLRAPSMRSHLRSAA